MHCSSWLTCASLAILAAPAYAQSGAFDLPTGGLVYSRGSRAVQPLLGVPGSTYLGGPVLKDISAAWIAPGGDWAFVSLPDHSAFMRGLRDGKPAESPASGLIDRVDLVVWNRDASFAVLYSSSSALLQRVRVANGRISPDDPMDLTPWGAAVTLAVDPAGRLAFGVAGAGIYLADGQQTPALLISMESPAAAAFSDTGRLYAVDARTRRIVEFGSDGSPSDFAAVEVPDGVDFEPVGMAVSGSGKYLMVADRATQTLRIYETSARTPEASIPLDFAPASIERLSSGATFVLNRPRGSEWLLVLDATDMPRVYFVPAGEEAAQ
jgi:hypothetical protein